MSNELALIAQQMPAGLDEAQQQSWLRRKFEELKTGATQKVDRAKIKSVINMGFGAAEMALGIFPQIRVGCLTRGIDIDEVIATAKTELTASMGQPNYKADHVIAYFKQLFNDRILPIILTEFLPTMQAKGRAHFHIPPERRVALMIRSITATAEDGTIYLNPDGSPQETPALYLFSDDPNSNDTDDMEFLDVFTTANLAELFEQQPREEESNRQKREAVSEQPGEEDESNSQKLQAVSEQPEEQPGEEDESDSQKQEAVSEQPEEQPAEQPGDSQRQAASEQPAEQPQESEAPEDHTDSVGE
jgi:hypothetical protein